MSGFEILRQNKPNVAEFIQHWQSKYQRSFNLSVPEEQANFYEAMLEISRHLANCSSTTTEVSVSVNNEGISGLKISVVSKS